MFINKMFKENKDKLSRLQITQNQKQMKNLNSITMQKTFKIR